MFAKREPEHLRERLSDIDRNLKLGKSDVGLLTREKVSTSYYIVPNYKPTYIVYNTENSESEFLSENKKKKNTVNPL